MALQIRFVGCQIGLFSEKEDGGIVDAQVWVGQFCEQLVCFDEHVISVHYSISFVVSILLDTSRSIT